MIEIIPFEKTDADKVASLILSIQREEFAIQITLKDQPDLLDVKKNYQNGNGNFWVARDSNRVIGTIALIDIGNEQVALRKMFVEAQYRGKEYGLAKRLLDTTFAWCKHRGVKQILLGTIDNYVAAQRFYEKNGFLEISADNLPTTFPKMAVDNKFYGYSF